MPPLRLPPIPDPDEAALVARLRAGDGEAYEVMLQQHAGRLLELARRFVRNEEDARDVLQEATLSAFKGIATFQAGARLSTWLHRIVVNSALMKLRSQKSRPQQTITDLLPRFSEDGHHAEPPSALEDRADTPAIRSETRAIVREAIDTLPETYRSALLMRDIEEMDTEETAAALGITANAVKIRLHRARQALRTLLDRRLPTLVS